MDRGSYSALTADRADTIPGKPEMLNAECSMFNVE
jgi:hypothetical protein